MRSEYQDPILMDHLEEGKTGGKPSTLLRRKQPSYYFKVFALTFVVVGTIITAYLLFPFKHNVNTAASVESNDPLLSQHHMCDTCTLNPDIEDYVLCYTCPFKVDETKTLKCPSGMTDVKVIRTSVGGKSGDASLSATIYNHCQDTMTDAVDFKCEFNLQDLAGLQPEQDMPEEEFFADEFMMDPQKFMEEFMPGEPPLPAVVLQSTQAAYAEFFKSCPQPESGEKAPRHPKCWDAEGNPTKPTVCDDGTPIERPHRGPPCAGDSRPACEDADGNLVLAACDADGTPPVEVPPCEDNSTPTCDGDAVVCLNKKTQESTPWVMGDRCPVGSHPKCETRGVKATCDDGSFAKFHPKHHHHHHGHGKGKGKGSGSEETTKPVILSKTHTKFSAYFKKCPGEDGKKPHPPSCWNGDEREKPTICADGKPLADSFPPCDPGVFPMCGSADAMTEMTCDPEGTEPEEISACEDEQPPKCDDGNFPVCHEEGEEAEALEEGEPHMCENGKPPMCLDGSKPTCSDGKPPRHPHGKGKGKGKGQQAVGQNGHGMAPPAMNQQPVGQNGHGIAPWQQQQPQLVNGMPPSDMNGVPMGGPQQQMVGQNGAGRPPPVFGQQQEQQQKGAGRFPQQQNGGSWKSWFQDAISPAASEHVLSATQQRPGPGFGRHPWQEQSGEQGGWDAPPSWEEKKGGHRFHHWDHWKKTHSGEVKVEFMCLK